MNEEIKKQRKSLKNKIKAREKVLTNLAKQTTRYLADLESLKEQLSEIEPKNEEMIL